MFLSLSYYENAECILVSMRKILDDTAKSSQRREFIDRLTISAKRRKKKILLYFHTLFHEKAKKFFFSPPAFLYTSTVELRMELYWNKMMSILVPFAYLGSTAISAVEEMGRIMLFFVESFAKMFYPSGSLFRILQQIHFIGMKSLLIVCLTGLFSGMVLGLQGYYTLVKFGSEALLGTAVALTLIRELGPVLTALMVTGRAGSSMAAELGIMQISEQIDALDTMDIDPVQFLVSPKLAASIISFPLLTAVFDVIGITGGYITGVLLLGIHPGTYFNRMEMGMLMKDINGGFIKSIFFALIVATICSYQGYRAKDGKNGHGARGVSMATTTAVVMSSILILVSDYVLTSFLM